MSLEFIAPLVREGAPAPESPMATAARGHGATLELRDGWLVPATFPDPDAQRQAIVQTVAFADASAMAKTELQASGGNASAGGEGLGNGNGCGLGLGKGLGHSLGLGDGLRLGTAILRDGAWWCPLTASRVLVLGTRPRLPDGDEVTIADVTSQLCALRLEGPLVRQLMARFCALDLREAVAPVGSLRPGSVARTPGLVLVEAPQRLLVMVGAALAEYLWTVVADGAQRLGGRAVGSDLLEGEIHIAQTEPANA